jgi:hypothetical protein
VLIILAVLSKNGVVNFWCVKNWSFASRVCVILKLCIKDVFYFVCNNNKKTEHAV